ncbi:histidine kinase [Leptospira gomenensis]|uniref:Histidine kinase n=1 Tax=Leptospira gomenensis TaxID=2484974 RepID=A0A5F1YT44_9LEPT|nr:histidine kinase [Leptospira gomenensis]TGK38620.1 histidine kinase [Leptospira gomenensis]TGK42857.1 histidine kinase [Leptospira gomenensis]TGK49598.1 histidine kinase [Leptospira gomenensis]TGK60732.1 histidine kinase [Leptospira gomenensis]
MAKSFQDLDQKLSELIQTRSRITVQSSRMNSKLEKYVLRIITEILTKVGQTRYIEMLYTITKEMSINGVKANQKRVFFEDEGLDIRNPVEYEKGMTAFKAKFSERMADEYGKRCLARGISVKLNITYTMDGLVVEVSNNTPVIEEEEERMREKMKKAMGYNDIAEFYMDNMDNTEGAGLGIALIMILLKSENIDPHLFRVMTREHETIARVEIPFNENYVSMRSKELKENHLGN